MAQRGRPRVIPIEALERERAWFPDIKTDRQHQNRLYAYRAMNLLGLTADEPPAELTWLADRKAIMAGDKKARIKWSILTELGRMYETGFPEADILTWARLLCQKRPKVKHAEALLQVAREDMRQQLRELLRGPRQAQGVRGVGGFSTKPHLCG